MSAPVCEGPKTTRQRRGAWSIRTWEETVAGKSTTFDALVVRDTARLMLAALDGATNEREPQRGRTLAALDVTSAHLRADVPVLEALDAAAAEIHDEAHPLRHHNGLVALAVVEEDRAGHLIGWRCADGEIWYRDPRSGRWVNLFPEDMLTAAGREAFESRPDGVGPFDWQTTVLEDLTVNWHSPTLGLDSASHARRRTVPAGVTELIITTDGSRMTADHAEHLDTWLGTDIHVLPEGWPYPAAHGDIGVIHARRL